MQCVKYEASILAVLTAATLAFSGCGMNSASEHQEIEKVVTEHAEADSIEFSDFVVSRFGTRACVRWETARSLGTAQLARAGEQWLVLRLKQNDERQCEGHLISRLDRRSEAYVELYYLLERGKVSNESKILELFSSLKGIDDLEYVNPVLDEQLTRYIEEIVRIEKSLWKAKRKFGEN